MVYWNIGAVLNSLYNAILRPSQFVSTGHALQSRSFPRVSQIGWLSLIYIFNLIMYAIPLSLTGVGVPESSDPPAIFNNVLSPLLSDPATVWRLTFATLQNSAFITAAALVTLLSYHVGAFLTFRSAGFVQSLHTIVYSTSAYLAGLFTAVWYLSTNDGVVAARDFVLAVQKGFIYWVIDLLGAEVGLPGGRPETYSAAGVTGQGRILLAIMLILLGYYIYSLYLGARINHDMPRTLAFVTVLFVFVSPILYVAGSVMASLIGIV